MLVLGSGGGTQLIIGSAIPGRGAWSAHRPLAAFDVPRQSAIRSEMAIEPTGSVYAEVGQTPHATQGLGIVRGIVTLTSRGRHEAEGPSALRRPESDRVAR